MKNERYLWKFNESFQSSLINIRTNAFIEHNEIYMAIA